MYTEYRYRLVFYFTVRVYSTGRNAEYSYSLHFMHKLYMYIAINNNYCFMMCTDLAISYVDTATSACGSSNTQG